MGGGGGGSGRPYRTWQAQQKTITINNVSHRVFLALLECPRHEDMQKKELIVECCGFCTPLSGMLLRGSRNPAAVLSEVEVRCYGLDFPAQSQPTYLERAVTVTQHLNLLTGLPGWVGHIMACDSVWVMAIASSVAA